MEAIIFSLIDGQRVPPRVIEGDVTISGQTRESFHVKRGCITVVGEVLGSIHLEPGATARIEGVQKGSLHVSALSRAYITGTVQGSVSVARNGTLVIEPSGLVQGSMSNEGLVQLRGKLAGTTSGDGAFHIEAGGAIVPPTLQRTYTFEL